MSSDQPQFALPWYRQFWPWFLLALPAAAVIGGILTVIIAVSNPDPLIQRPEDERIGPAVFEAVRGETPERDH